MITLRHLFVGLVLNYRSLNLRFGHPLESRSEWTAAELGWFARVGEGLGFLAVRERDVLGRACKVDLAWIDQFTSEVVLHVERENNPSKIRDTIVRKLLPTGSSCGTYCIGIFDELRPHHLHRIAAMASRSMEKSISCKEALFVCYSQLPSVREARAAGMPRYRMEWPVRAVYLKRGRDMEWLDARCTTDNSNIYTMHLVDPALPPPYRKRQS